jgi:hypothetical protein
VEVQKLRASDWNLASGDRFGDNLCLRGDRLLVGAERGGYNGPLSGTAYIFERENGVWSEVERLVPSDPNPYPGAVGNPSAFASSVALDGANGRILIGAKHAYLPAYQEEFPGKAYFFDVNQGSVVCAGAPTRLTLTGSRVVGDANLALSVYEGPPGMLGIFLVGPGGPPVPFGLGDLCVGQGFDRLPGVFTIGATGSVMHQVDFSAPPAASLLLAGTTLTFQFAHRDQILDGTVPIINASDAVEVVLQ